MTAAAAFRIDTHAHVFPRVSRVVPRPRYMPRGAAPLHDYLAQLDRFGLTHGVLVQPSFLGADNSHLVAHLAQDPARLRGVAVVDRRMSDEELAALAAAGVVGIRLNLLDAPAERYRVGTRLPPHRLPHSVVSP